MGRDLHYRPGSWYMVDDRSGFPERAEKMKREWDNLMVDERRWEPRQPQDYVRGVRDDQTVPVARPISTPSFVGPSQTTLAQAAAPRATVIYVESLSGFVRGHLVRVMLDDESLHAAIAVDLDPASGTITLSAGLRGPASAGGVVYDMGYAPPTGGPIRQQGGQNTINTQGGGPLELEG